MINRVVLVGRLVRDPELRRLENGTGVCSFTIAIDNRTNSKENKTTSFIPCTAWRQQAEFLSKYAKKGTLIGIDGHLLQRSFEKKDGTKQSTLDVVCDTLNILESKNTTSNRATSTEFTTDKPIDDDDIIVDFAEDDLPF